MIEVMNRTTLGLGAVLFLATSAVVLACSSSTSTPSGTGTQSTAAAVAGAADTHCEGKPIVVVDPAACHADAGAGHSDEDAGDAGEDAGMKHDEPTDGADDYGPAQYGSEGEDDECKYHVTWTSSPVTANADVTLVVVATKRKDSSPVAAAKPYAEIFLDDQTPGPNTPVTTTETSPGTYTIGPVRFSKSGKWTVRFHFAADCNDGETSPHGHAAFFVNVP